MDGGELVNVVLLCTAVAIVAFLLGRRRRDREAVEERGVTPEPPDSTEEPASEESADAASPASSPPASTPPASTPPASTPPASTPPASTPPASSSAQKEKASAATPLARIEYEEDTDVDPTRVGGRAQSGAPRGERVIYQPPLKQIVFDEGTTDEEPSQPPNFLVHATAQTDTGLRRKRNEDALLVDDAENLFVIADGMGGYKGGQLASSLAVKTIGAAFAAKEFEGPPHEGVVADATNLARAIQMANAAILEVAKERPDLEGMGTTVCSALFTPSRRRMFLGHVGDSRCYRLRDGVLKQMTADHTMADHGVVGPESQQLSRAVGIWPTVPIDIVYARPEIGDVYLLCSDGLTKMLPNDVIRTVISAEPDPKEAVDRLILFANGRGGKDNITVILVRVVPPGEPKSPAAGKDD